MESKLRNPGNAEESKRVKERGKRDKEGRQGKKRSFGKLKRLIMEGNNRGRKK